MTYYTYRHNAGYGRDDHMADEIIARAARQLGMATGHAVAQCVGLASHSVPMAGIDVRIPSAPGVRAKMAKALRAARAELARNPDCSISIELMREQRELLERSEYRDEHYRRRVSSLWRVSLQRKVGRDWRTESMTDVEDVR